MYTHTHTLTHTYTDSVTKCYLIYIVMSAVWVLDLVQNVGGFISVLYVRSRRL